MGVVFQLDQVEMAQNGRGFHALTVDLELKTLIGQITVDVIGVVDHGAVAVKLEELAMGAKDKERLRQ